MLLNQNTSLQHLGLPVGNIEVSKKWYTDILGFEVIHEKVIPGEEGDMYVAFLKLNGFMVEMYQLTGRDLEEIKARGHGHIDHIAFNVDDIEAVFEKLNDAGIKALEGAPAFLPFWENGVRFLTILGPDGEKIEFNQRLRTNHT